MSTPILLSVALLAISGFVIALLPFTGGTRLARAYLAVLILVNALVYFFRLLLLWESPLAITVEYFVRFFSFAVGPVVLLYTRDVLSHPGGRREMLNILFWGALPALLGVCAHTWLRTIVPEIHASAQILDGRTPTRWYESVAALFFASVQSLFIVKAWSCLRDYKSRFENVFSSDVSLQLRWIRIFLMVVALWVVVMPVGHTVARLVSPDVPSKWTVPVSMLPVFLLFFFAFQHALRRPRPIESVHVADSTEAAIAPSPGIAPQAGPAAAARRDTAKKIRRLLEEDRFYLDPEASLTGLARSLDVSTHQVSQVISMEFSTNFYGLVNSYRTKEAARLLRDREYADTSILEIALQSGFNSKAAFNRIFRQAFALTPREYRKGA